MKNWIKIHFKEDEKAKELYKKALEEFPESGMEKAGLNMLEALK